MAKISVIICSVNPVLYGRIHAHYTQLLAKESHEIIGIHDARGLCEGYNRGLERSRGDIVIFSHDDIEIWQPDFAGCLCRHLDKYDVVGAAGTARLMAPWWSASPPPYVAGQIARPCKGGFEVSFLGGYRRAMGGMQAMDGLFLAFRRNVIERLRWDAQTFTGFHGYDVDCTFRAFQMGFSLAVALDLPMLHQSPGTIDDAWDYFNQAFVQKHGSRLPAYQVRPNLWACVQVPTKEEAWELMRYYYEVLPE
jgi:GT2 family glycosyltransferase